MRLKDKVAIITGAGQSMGRTATLMFCKEGAKVVAVDWHLEEVTETVKMAREAGGDAIVGHADVRKEAQVEQAVKLAVDTYGKLDVLYNNAAVDPAPEPVTQVSERTLDFILAVNLKGTFFFCKHAIPEMIKAGGGSIINVASIVVLAGSGNDAYTASKSAVRGLSRSIAAGYATQKVRCNTIFPGGIVSAGHRHTFESAEALERLRGLIPSSIGPMERHGTQAEVVNCAIYLASDESTFTTGAEIVIDGGAATARHSFKGDVDELLNRMREGVQMA